jgi:hypothetical protein
MLSNISGERTSTPKTFELTAFSGEFWKNLFSYATPGANCAVQLWLFDKSKEWSFVI